MANTFTKIAAVTVGSGGAASIDFTSIPGTYTDLCIKISGRTARTNVEALLSMAFNSSSSNYSNIYIEGDGSAAYSFTTSANTYNVGFVNSSTSTANTFNNTEVYIPNYAGSNYKSFSVDNVDETNGTTIYCHLIGGIWSDTSAITSITFTPTSGNFVQYSTITLYGISKS